MGIPLLLSERGEARTERAVPRRRDRAGDDRTRSTGSVRGWRAHTRMLVAHCRFEILSMMRGSRNLCQQLVSGVALQSLRDLHEFGCELGQHILIVGIAHALGDLPRLPGLLTEYPCDIDGHLVCRLLLEK